MAQRTIPTPPGLDEQGNPVDTENPYGRSYGTINICKFAQRGGIDKVLHIFVLTIYKFTTCQLRKLN
jgi:hypothetical protein